MTRKVPTCAYFLQCNAQRRNCLQISYREGLGVVFQMFAILRVVLASTVLEITLALVYVVEAVLTDEKDEGNAGNGNGGNNSDTVLYLFFRPISTK